MLTSTSALWRSIRCAGRSALFATIGLLFIAAIGLTGLRASGKYVLAVQSSSMAPTFQRGDALIIASAKAADLKPGDVVSYHSPADRSVIVTHRLISIDRLTGRLTTAGDSTGKPDPAFGPDLVAGRAMAVAPNLGYVLDALRHPLGLVLAVYLPAILIIAAEIQHLSRSYARPSYSARL